jgi:predicted acyl esterase
LSTEPPSDEPPDVYLYNPFPTVGGQVLFPGGNANGPRDQRAVELRDDVLVYSTPVLDQPRAEAAKDYRPAINRISHDAAHLSRLILPIIER